MATSNDMTSSIPMTPLLTATFDDNSSSSFVPTSASVTATGLDSNGEGLDLDGEQKRLRAEIHSLHVETARHTC